MKTPEEMADDELIECDGCHICLNGKSLWVVSDFITPLTLCESCYWLLRNNKNEQIA